MVITRRRVGLAAAVAALTVALGCTLGDQTRPDFVGPSEMALSLTIAVNPDTLRWDGASRSLVSIQARNSTGQPAANVSAVVEVVAVDPTDPTRKIPYDLGAISARSIVTGPDGRAAVTYTAPLLPGSSGELPIWIWVTPSETNAASQVRREVMIRLLPPGTILPPNGTPVPDFTMSGTKLVGSTITFDASLSKDDDGTIVSYSWNFGDGASGTGKVATHSYSTSGTFNVTLTVTDDRGLSASKTGSLLIEESNAPTAVFTSSPTNAKLGEMVYFNGQQSTAAPGRRITLYSWDFGDGDEETGETASHDYMEVGSFVVTLVVTDDIGKSGSTSATVTVTQGLTAAFTISPAAGTVGASIIVNAATSTKPAGRTIVTYAWDFGNGSASSGASPTASVSYGAIGTFTITLTITDDLGNRATTTKTISIS